MSFAAFFPEMIMSSAKEGGIKVPNDLTNYTGEDYIPWVCYQVVQLGSPVDIHEDWVDNARLINSIEEDRLITMTFNDFIKAGFYISHSPLN